MWKRGPQEDSTKPFEMNEIQEELDVEFQFARVSTFYKNKSGKYESKMCEFHMFRVVKGEKGLIGKVSFDMAPYVGYSDKPCTIDFPGALCPGAFIEVVWTIMETSADKDLTNRISRQSLAI